MNARPDQLNSPQKPSWSQRLRQWVVDWLVKDLHLRGVSFGENSITMSPSGVGDVVRWSAAQAAADVRDLGMDANGRPSAYIGGAARAILGDHEVIQPDGSVTFTANQPMGGFKITGLAAGSGTGDAVRFDEAIVEGGGNAFTADQSMGSNKLTNLATPTATTDAATKAYVDSLVSGVQWIEPADVDGYVGNATIATINGLTPTTGDVYVATDAGTPTAGTSDALVAGSVAEYDGTQWQEIVAGSGGFVPDGTRLITHETTALISPNTDATDEGKIALFDGLSNTPTYATPVDGDAILINGDGAQNTNKAFVFDGTVPSGTWTQFAGTGGDHGALTGVLDDDHSQYALLSGNAARNPLSGTLELANSGGAITAEAGGGGGIDLTNGYFTLPSASGLIAVSSVGQIVVGTDDDKIIYHDGAAQRTIANLAQAQSFSNKELNAATIINGMTVTDNSNITPDTTGEGRVGTSALKFLEVNALTVTSGDHVFEDRENGWSYRVKESATGLSMYNEKTGAYMGEIALTRGGVISRVLAAIGL